MNKFKKGDKVIITTPHGKVPRSLRIGHNGGIMKPEGCEGTVYAIDESDTSYPYGVEFKISNFNYTYGWFTASELIPSEPAPKKANALSIFLAWLIIIFGFLSIAGGFAFGWYMLYLAVTSII